MNKLSLKNSRNISIGIVIVNYNSGNLLRSCLASIRKFELFKYCKIIIVDTGSIDNSLEVIDKDYINIIKTGNIGFGAACNLGARYINDDYILFLNADTEISFVDSESLLCVLNNSPALIAPSIMQSGMLVNNVLPFFSATCDALLRDVGLWAPKSLVINNETGVAVDFDGWASGAALIVNTEVFKKIKGFDEQFFLYYEEVDLCRRIKNSGGRLIYLPSLVVQHVGGGSSGGLNFARTAMRYESKLAYWYKHGKKFDFRVFKILSILMLGLKIIRALIISRERYKIPAYFYALKLYVAPRSRFEKIRAKTWWWKQALEHRSMYLPS